MIVQFSFTSFLIWLCLLIASAKLGVEYGDQTYTLQTLVVILCGATTGKLRAFIVVAFYLFLGNWFPVFNGRGVGSEVFDGNTFGYLIAFPWAAMLAADYKQNNWYTNSFIFMLIHFFILMSGALWLMQHKNLSAHDACEYGVFPYLLFATIKSVAASFIFYGLNKYMETKNS